MTCSFLGNTPALATMFHFHFLKLSTRNGEHEKTETFFSLSSAFVCASPENCNFVSHFSLGSQKTSLFDDKVPSSSSSFITSVHAYMIQHSFSLSLSLSLIIFSLFIPPIFSILPTLQVRGQRFIEPTSKPIKNKEKKLS